jgi:hypothetical protein
VRTSPAGRAAGFSLLLFAGLLVLCGCRTTAGDRSEPGHQAWLNGWKATNSVWRGLHIMLHADSGARELEQEFPRLKAAGINTIIVEVNYCFEFRSHPELRSASFVTAATAHAMARSAREQGIRLIPQFNCIGHQSWAQSTLPLLVKYPQLDETPGQYPENKGIYCRSWCTRNPEVNKVVLPLLDELVEAFEADALHLGMDEIFLIGSPHCERCKGRDPGQLLADAINGLHDHFSTGRRVELLLWGDRLLDAAALGYSEWEAAKNGTHTALERIPKDIIICDWHYAKQEEYRSVPMLARKGFRVWPSGWQPLDGAVALSKYSREQRRTEPLVMGYLCTTWGKVKTRETADWPCLVEPLRVWSTPR